MGPTRQRLLDLLKRRAEATARELAGAIGVTAPAVRQHLTALERDGLVAGRTLRRPIGRPVRLYRLTAAAEPHFPSGYGPLALDLLRLVRATGGARAITTLLARRRAALLATYRKRLRATGKPRAWTELARIRDEEGYVCEAPAGGNGLVEHHCPIAAAAREFPEVCRQEHLLFESALGRRLTRTEHLASGGSACRYILAGATAAPAASAGAARPVVRTRRRRTRKPGRRARSSRRR